MAEGIRVNCSHGHERLVPIDMVGCRVSCLECGQSIDVPSAPQLPAMRDDPLFNSMVTDPVEEIDCPSCAERIKAAAKVCRFCGRDIDRSRAENQVGSAPLRSSNLECTKCGSENVQRLSLVADLSRRFAPPPQQPQKPTGQYILGGFFMTVVCWFSLAAYGVSAGWVVASSIGIGTMFALGSRHRYHRDQLPAWTAAMGTWRAKMDIWDRSWVCGRCGLVFTHDL